ncbi:hypothetical protein DFH08DRAFT_952917 [Mycena albidolilacea]|uniref:Uncharacterized protein n=1 Tax=Mycena albidolilacea TaxID=1033008 RepID=A0AAD7AIX5_9AGAR|nr:hypothetical protein DFH08DRAFT_952917 [Mycena albidolilacea]
MPDFSLTRHMLPAKGGALRSKRMKAYHKQNVAVLAPVMQCNTAWLIPCPFGPSPHSQKLNYKEVYWQLQTIRQSQLLQPPVGSQED